MRDRRHPRNLQKSPQKLNVFLQILQKLRENPVIKRGGNQGLTGDLEPYRAKKEGGLSLIPKVPKNVDYNNKKLHLTTGIFIGIVLEIRAQPYFCSAVTYDFRKLSSILSSF